MKAFETAWRLEGHLEGGDENQDRVGICEEPNALVFVVADGEGGDERGTLASRRAVEIVRKAISGERPNDDSQVWAERLAGIDRMLQRDRQAGETSAIVASIVPPYGNARKRRIVGASVGTCEAWLITPAGIHKVTDRQENEPLLGSGVARPVAFDVEWTEGTLLVATDGLFRHTSPERISSTALDTDIERAADAMLALPRLPDGRLPDDAGMLLCRSKSHSTTSNRKSILQFLHSLWNWGRQDQH